MAGFPEDDEVRLSSERPNHDEIDFELLGNLSAFHTYSTVWNRQRIIFMIDNIPIRVFNNMESIGIPFPSNQPMRIYSSIWNADDWAIRASQSSCASKSTNSLQAANWQDQTLDAAGRNRIRWVQRKYMVYNYYTDLKRFPQGLPPECKRSRFL
ncbi:hypothetical protein PTKIN_Ptkin07bG0073900 [Pterospermum kingtungense]